MDGTHRFGRTRLLSLLKDGRGLTPQKAAKLGSISERQARNILRELHTVERCTYISSWRRNEGGRRWIAEYRLGRRTDAQKPPPLSVGERAGRYRERMRLDDERGDFVRGARSARRRVIRPDQLAMSLMPWLYAEGTRRQLVVPAAALEAATSA